MGEWERGSVGGQWLRSPMPHSPTHRPPLTNGVTDHQTLDPARPCRTSPAQRQGTQAGFLEQTRQPRPVFRRRRLEAEAFRGN